jgi:outer membrane protein assembly factor BamB
MKRYSSLQRHCHLIAMFVFTFGCMADRQDGGNDPGEQESADDGVSEDAPDILLYAALSEGCCGEDPHPVHGTESEAGSYVLCGKSIDAEGNADGFLVKIDTSSLSGTVFLEEGSENRYSWSTTFGSTGNFDAANGVAALDSAIFMAGVTTVSGRPQRALHKYDMETGELLWSTTFDAPPTGLESAFESIAVTSGGGAVAVGFVNGEPDGIEGFKSYGNPISGQANVMFFSAELLASSDAPESPTWEKTYDLGSIRAIRPVGDDGFVVVAAQDESNYVVVRLDSEGDEQWRTELVDHGEATDIAVLANEESFVISGHKDVNGGIDGSVTKLDATGAKQWGKTYGDPAGGMKEFAGLSGGNPKLIFDECWGIQPTDDGGAVVACGTGIEGCDEVAGDISVQTECLLDPRVKWRSLVFEIDNDGRQVWYRTDSYYFPDEPGTGAATASEFVIKATNGQLTSVMDQDFGIGLLVLEPSN